MAYNPIGQGLAGLGQGIGAGIKERRMDSKLQGLLQKVQGGDEMAMAELAGMNPNAATAIQNQQAMATEQAQLQQQEQIKNVGIIANTALGIEDPAKRRAYLIQRMEQEQDPEIRDEIADSLNMDDDQLIYDLQEAVTQVKGIEGIGSDTPAGVREFEAKVQAAGLEPGSEEYKRAALIQLGMEPRAGISASERIAQDPELARRVAALEAQTTTATESAKQDVKAKSPEEQRKQRETAKATKMEIANANAALDQIDNLTGSEEYIDAITGVSGKIPKIPGTEGFDAEVAFNQFKDTLTLENLGKMSGVLSETDIRILSSAASGLEAGMSKNAFRSRMKEIRSVLESKSEAAKKRLKAMGLDVDAVEERSEADERDRSQATIMEDAQGNRAYVYPDGTVEEI